MKNLLKTLCVLILGMWSMTNQANTAPVDSDTYLDGSNTGQQNRNFGATSTVIVSSTSKALLTFKLSALPISTLAQDVKKATLFFYVKSVTKTGKLQVSPLINPWLEQAVTYKTAPFQDAVMANSAAVTQAQTYFAVDVTQIVKKWLATPATNFGLVIEPDASTPNTAITFDAKEASTTSHEAYLDIVLASAGPKGDPGVKGAPGLPGVQGPPGPKGETPKISTTECIDLPIQTNAWTMCPTNTVMVGIHESGLATGSKHWFGSVRCCGFK